MLDCKVATIVLVLFGVLAPAFSLKRGTSLEDNLVCIRGNNDAVKQQLETFKRVYILENLFLNISDHKTPSPSRWSEELCQALRTHQHFHSITISKIEKIEFPFRIVANHLHITFSPEAVDCAHKRMKPISFEGSVVKSLTIEVATDGSVPSPSTSLRQLRLNENLTQLTLHNFGKFYEFVSVLDNCRSNMQAITWVGEQGVVSAKCAGSHIIAHVEPNSLKAELMDFVDAAQLSSNVTVLLSENLIHRTSSRTLQNFLNPIKQYHNVQNSLVPRKEGVRHEKNSLSRRFSQLGSELRWKSRIFPPAATNAITKGDQNSRSSSSIGKSFSMRINSNSKKEVLYEKKFQRIPEAGSERGGKQVVVDDEASGFPPSDIPSPTRAITKNDKNSLSSRFIRKSMYFPARTSSTLMKYKPSIPNMKKPPKPGHQSTTAGQLNDDGLTSGLVDYLSFCDDNTPSLQFHAISTADAKPCSDIEHSSKEEGTYTLNPTEKVIRVENLTRANGSSAHVDGPAPRPVFIASHGLAAPLPLPQNHLEEVNETSLLVSIEDTTTSVSRERNGPNVNLAFRISIVVFFCCLLPLLVAFCIYRYSRSRSSLIKPVSFALKTRAVMRSI